MRKTPPRITSLPLGPLEQVSLAYLDRGRNQQSRSYSQLCDESLAHIWAFHGNEEFDPDTGRHHLAEAVASLLTLMRHVFEDTGNDDRPHPISINPNAVEQGLGIGRPARVLKFPKGPDEDD